MKKLTLKVKQNTKHLNSTLTYTIAADTLTLQFDKIGRLCEMTPRIGDLFNVYRGRQRNCIPEIISHKEVKNYYYGN